MCFKQKVYNSIREFLLKLDFVNYWRPYIHGPKERLIVGKNCSLVNTVFNTVSGKIIIEDYVLFGHNCMVLTGKHDYLAALENIEMINQVPSEGRDIIIGQGSWICSGSIICGKVTIGKHCVVMAGAVVTKDVPDYCMVGGVPATIIKKLK